MKETDEYHKQAQDFLDRHGIKFHVRKLRDAVPAWHKKAGYPDWTCRFYCVTFSRENPATTVGFRIVPTGGSRREETGIPSKEFSLTFIGSRKDYQEGRFGLVPYDVLASISGDPRCADMPFHVFCAEYGYNEDSREAYRNWQGLRKQAKKMVEFFTPEELEEMEEIR